MSRGKTANQDLKDPTNFLPKMVANCSEDLFFWSSPDFGKKCLQFPAKTLFLFLVFIQLRRRKCIISTKLFVKLVKAAKASPHAKFYNVSTASRSIVAYFSFGLPHIAVTDKHRPTLKTKIFGHIG